MFAITASNKYKEISKQTTIVMKVGGGGETNCLTTLITYGRNPGPGRGVASYMRQ